MIRSVHVVPDISEEASGPTYSVCRLAESLRDYGQSARIAAVRSTPEQISDESVELFPRSLGPEKLGFSKAMRRSLRRQAIEGHIDILHNHSLWMMPNVYPGWAVRGAACRLVFSPHGTLAPWALRHSWLTKAVFWKLVQGPAVRRADLIYVTADSEYQDVRRAGLRQPVCIIPNGIDLRPLQPRDVIGRRRLLFLGRIHRKKGIDTLLRAWARVAVKFDDWELRIAGPDNGGYLHEMEQLSSDLRAPRVTFEGALYGDSKYEALQDAELFVLPTHSENFGIAVAEALQSGTPAIVTKGAPWEGLVAHSAGWWVDDDVDVLTEALMVAMSETPDALKRMGQAGRAWMERDYSWSRIGEMTALTYEWLRTDGVKPSWVRLD